jgi:predicted metalloprotease with PDZ domain
MSFRSPVLRAGLTVLLLFVTVTAAHAQDVQYRISLPEPQHHWMLVEAIFSGLPDGAAELHMSRSSPGRYALHEFAKNVYDLKVTDASGRALAVSPITPSQWGVAGQRGTLRVSYRVFGDRVDGTYASIDTTHAHLNMPASLLWVPGLELRPVRVTFVRPAAGPDWSVATQLFPTGDPLVFTAPNLQYLMDSPAEFGVITWRAFEEPFNADGSGAPAHIRIALHHAGNDADADAYAAGVKAIVEAERAVFGELPPYENGTYTFLADYVPWASGDGMEHRNSTVMTSRVSLASGRSRLLNTVAHEFFHCWNVERIRPKTLEPFDFDRANMSGELWLAEGVTSYYDGLVMARAGLFSIDEFARDLSSIVAPVLESPSSRFRSAEDMSRLAPLVDAAQWIDRTNWENTAISYYTFGAALGLGFDLAIRAHTHGRATLDDFMRAMWRTHGKPGGTLVGYVDHPYTPKDIRDRLAEITDQAFADVLMSKYVQGRERMDYAQLLTQAGFTLRKAHPGQPSLGTLQLETTGNRVRISAPTLIGDAAYLAGLDLGDEILVVGETAVSSTQQLADAIASRKVGDTLSVRFLRRGVETSSVATLQEDARLEVVSVESAGGTLTEAQKAFRKAWIG